MYYQNILHNLYINLTLIKKLRQKIRLLSFLYLINFLKFSIETLKKDKRKKMVLTNYLFFSAILNEKLYSPNRTHTLGGVSFPIKGNKYYLEYKKYFSEILKKNKIEVIYIISSDYIVEDRLVYDYLDKSCITEHSYNEQLKKFELEKCKLI